MKIERTNAQNNILKYFWLGNNLSHIAYIRHLFSFMFRDEDYFASTLSKRHTCSILCNFSQRRKWPYCVTIWQFTKEPYYTSNVFTFLFWASVTLQHISPCNASSNCHICMTSASKIHQVTVVYAWHQPLYIDDISSCDAPSDSHIYPSLVLITHQVNAVYTRHQALWQTKWLSCLHDISNCHICTTFASKTHQVTIVFARH